MKKIVPASDAESYVGALDGWRRECVTALRSLVRESVPGLEEAIKWGHIVYFSNGPVLLIRAEESRVLFGFWRGSRLRDIEPRLKPGGKYEMATLDLREEMTIAPEVARRLTKQAVELNKRLGDPTQDAKSAASERSKKR